MHVLENLKKTLGKVTGVGKPSGNAARRAVRRSKPQAIMFRDDGSIPNNARLPFLLYRGAVGLTGSTAHKPVWPDTPSSDRDLGVRAPPCGVSHGLRNVGVGRAAFTTRGPHARQDLSRPRSRCR